MCLICSTAADPTVEHIIPQALWRRFGLDPDAPRLDRYRTQLCGPHNRATSALHNRPDLLDLIEKGEPQSRRTLTQLADWAVWVTLLLGLRSGHGVLAADESREILRKRFDGQIAGPPRGIRVYAARVADYVRGADFVKHEVAVQQDDRVTFDETGQPAGFSIKSGPITATEAIGIGRIAMLVLARTHSSGVDHNTKLDAAAATVGLELIHPLPTPIPELFAKDIDMTAVSDVFMPPGHGDEISLLPPKIRELLDILSSDTESDPFG